MTKTITQNEAFETSDLGLATALISGNYKLASLKRIAHNKVQFVFLFTASINKTIEDYWSDDLKVNARTYFDNLKALKNRIYSN